jgi:hypothetical protein
MGALQPLQAGTGVDSKRNLEAHGITTSRDDVELVGSAAAGEHYIESDD